MKYAIPEDLVDHSLIDYWIEIIFAREADEIHSKGRSIIYLSR